MEDLIDGLYLVAFVYDPSEPEANHPWNSTQVRPNYKSRMLSGSLRKVDVFALGVTLLLTVEKEIVGYIKDEKVHWF